MFSTIRHIRKIRIKRCMPYSHGHICMTHSHKPSFLPTTLPTNSCKKDVKYDMIIADLETLKDINCQLTTMSYLTMVSTVTSNFLWIFHFIVNK